MSPAHEMYNEWFPYGVSTTRCSRILTLPVHASLPSEEIRNDLFCPFETSAPGSAQRCFAFRPSV